MNAATHGTSLTSSLLTELHQADHADVLLQAVFDKLDEAKPAALGTAAINCFTTYVARAVLLMRKAADSIIALVAEGEAA